MASANDRPTSGPSRPSASTPSFRARRPRSLWREAPIVLPSALLLFALLGLATLLFYRSAVERFGLEREDEALAIASRMAERLSAGSERIEEQIRALPAGAAVAILDAEGRRLAVAGATEAFERPLAALPAALARAPSALRPRETGTDLLVAIVPFRVDSSSATGDAEAQRYLRLDLPSRTLAAESRRLVLLTPLVVGLSLAAALVVTLFFRALVRPFETLVERARAMAGGTAEVPAARADELDFLLATFDRALATLGAPGGELAPLAGALGSTLDGGFLLLDPQGKLLVATPAAAELLGEATPAAGEPLAVALVRAGDGGPESGTALANAIAEGAPLPRSTFRFRSGELERTIGLALEPLRGERGRLRGFLAIVADVRESERAAARERLAEGLAQLGELSAGVAHELRNGLATLAGWIQLLLRRPLETEAAECARELDRETRQMGRVVEDFLAFARPGTRRVEAIDLADLVRRVARSPGGDEPSGAKVELRVEAEPAPIAGDPLLLERALDNLVANAREASGDAPAQGGPAPVVEISLERSTRSAPGFLVCVADRGPGIPAAIRERLFEPFVSARPGGVGLGLALARRIVLLHGGEIEASDRPGGGTVVRIELPGSTSVTKGAVNA